MNTIEQQIIIFVGRSGSGKGTQADLLQKNLPGKTLYIGTGAYFRKMIATENLTGRLYKDAYARGELAPDFLVTTYLGNVFLDEYTGTENMLFDGVARLPQEAKALTDMFTFYQLKKVKVVYINVSPEWALDKTAHRGRSDDKGSDVKAKWYEEKVLPVMDYFKQTSLYEFIEVNGEQTIDQVHQEILTKL